MAQELPEKEVEQIKARRERALKTKAYKVLQTQPDFSYRGRAMVVTMPQAPWEEEE